VHPGVAVAGDKKIAIIFTGELPGRLSLGLENTF